MVKYTKGPATVEQPGYCSDEGRMVYGADSKHIASWCKPDDAALIAEAFNVASETGLTPRQLAEQRERLLAALAKIEKWFGEFPPTGRTWENSNGTPSDRPMSYAACYGSNGERDFMRGIARSAIADAEGATP